jgi:hypothetical protein
MKYTSELLAAAVKDSHSVYGVMRKLGIRLTGGGHAHIKSRLIRFGIDTSHFLGKRANCGLNHRGPRKRLPEELLVLRDPSRPPVGALTLRSALLGRRHLCEVCGLENEWRGQPLVLQIDHFNGCHFDNRPENLRFLCPNCHSQTASFGRRNRAYESLGGSKTTCPSRDGLSSRPSS